MARRPHRTDPQPGDEGFLPLTDRERRAHADALALSHAGHHCAERAAGLREAGEYYAMIGDHDLAEQMFREACGIDDAEPGLAHAVYAAFLFDRHRHDEALAKITEARRLRPTDPDVFSIIGEALAEHGHPEQAARWFTAGLVAHLGYLADLTIDDLRYDVDARSLAGGRHQARQALALPEDHVDALVEELHRADAVTAAGE